MGWFSKFKFIWPYDQKWTRSNWKVTHRSTSAIECDDSPQFYNSSVSPVFLWPNRYEKAYEVDKDNSKYKESSAVQTVRQVVAQKRADTNDWIIYQ